MKNLSGTKLQWRNGKRRKGQLRDDEKRERKGRPIKREGLRFTSRGNERKQKRIRVKSKTRNETARQGKARQGKERYEKTQYVSKRIDQRNRGMVKVILQESGEEKMN